MDTSIQILTMGTGGTVGWMCEKQINVHRLYLASGGDGFYSVGGRSEKFKAGYGYFLPSTCPYELQQDSSSPFRHTFVDFRGSIPFYNPGIWEINPADNALFPPIFQFLETMITNLSYEHHRGFRCCPISSIKLLSPLIGTTVAQLLRFASQIYHIPTVSNPTLLPALTYIHENYAKKLQLDELAAMSCMEKSYFITKFRSETGCTPYQYIQTLRLDTVSLLQSNGMPLNHAAEQAGFSSLQSYYRAKSHSDADS